MNYSLELEISKFQSEDKMRKYAWYVKSSCLFGLKGFGEPEFESKQSVKTESRFFVYKNVKKNGEAENRIE